MSKRSLMWVYFLFSIPYGKGKGVYESDAEKLTGKSFNSLWER